jgi:sporulation protein YlmC with PRC-barrel domain
MRGQKLIRTKVMAAALALTTLLPCTIGGAFSEDAQPAANNQPTGPAANTPQPQPPAAVTILNDHEVESILGREVVSSASEDMGRIVDVLVDRRGQVRAAIIDFGGFLGVGSRKIAVDWSALQFPPPGKTDAKITLEFTRDQVKAAPEYQEGKPIVVLSALGKLEPLPE